MNKREHILLSTLKVIGDVGYGKTTMSAVAKQADIGKSTIYEYFDSKDAMIMESTVHFAELWITRLNDEAWRIGHDFESILYQAIALSLKYLSEEFEKPASLFHGFQDMNLSNDMKKCYSEAMTPVMEVSKKQAFDLIALGQKEGVIRQDIDDVEIEFTLRTIVVLTASLLRRGPSTLPEYDKSREEMIGYIIKYITNALK